MREMIDLTWKELNHEMKLRSMGKKGEWKLPTKVLLQLWFAKRANLPAAIARPIPKATK